MKSLCCSVAFFASAVAWGSDVPSSPAAAVQAAQLPVEDSDRAGNVNFWKISLIPLLGSQALDAASSYGMRELNPLLGDSNGGFGMKAVSIKLGVIGILSGMEYLIVKKYPRSARVITKLNWTSGIVTGGFAVHNYAIK